MKRLEMDKSITVDQRVSAVTDEDLAKVVRAARGHARIRTKSGRPEGAQQDRAEAAGE